MTQAVGSGRASPEPVGMAHWVCVVTQHNERFREPTVSCCPHQDRMELGSNPQHFRKIARLDRFWRNADLCALAGRSLVQRFVCWSVGGCSLQPQAQRIELFDFTAIHFANACGAFAFDAEKATFVQPLYRLAHRRATRTETGDQHTF
jgi:hypothetical protein